MRTVSLTVFLSAASCVMGHRHSPPGNGLMTLTVPPLDVIKNIIISTAATDFASNTKAYEAASSWNRDRLSSMPDRRAPYVACANYKQGRGARSRLEDAISFASVEPLSHTKAHGACFVVTALPSEASAIMNDPVKFSLVSMGPFFSNLKIAPGLLSHAPRSVKKAKHFPTRLRTTYGPAIIDGQVHGLLLQLTPGVLESSSEGAATMFEKWRADFTSGSGDMWKTTFWSDPDVRQAENGRHPADHEEGTKLVHEWTQAASLVHEVAAAHGWSTGEVCGWDRVTLHLSDNELVVIQGTLIGDQYSSREEPAGTLWFVIFVHASSYIAHHWPPMLLGV